MSYYEIDYVVDEILERLAKFKPYIYHQATTTNSIYIKFDNPRLCSIRISDHNGKEKYLYKWNVRTDIMDSYNYIDQQVRRYFYSPDHLQELYEDIELYNDSLNEEWY